MEAALTEQREAVTDVALRSESHILLCFLFPGAAWSPRFLVSVLNPKWSLVCMNTYIRILGWK